jgi:phosphohistidine phosphatase SixA
MEMIPEKRFTGFGGLIALVVTALLFGAFTTRRQLSASPVNEISPTDTRPAALLATPSITPVPPTATPTPEPTATMTASPTPEPTQPLTGAALVEALQQGGYVIYFRNAASDLSQTDSDTQNLGNCEKQRNLIDRGRREAGIIGEAFQALDIPIGRVLSSGYCRSRQTAQIAFGKTEITADLTGFAGDLLEERIAILRRMLSTPPRRGLNTVLVGHDTSIRNAADISMAEGEAAVFAPHGAYGFTLVRRLLPGEWAALARLLVSPTPPAPTASAEPSGQPDLLLPDLQTLPPSDLVIQMSYFPEERKLLRLTNSVVNVGLGPLEVLGVTNQATGDAAVIQQLYTKGGSVEEQSVGEFLFHPDHNHWHIEDFARYEVWSLTARGDLDSLVALTEKVSYCLRDNTPARIAGSPPQAVYTVCGQELQGISPGWIDTYKFELPGQIVDITAVPDGMYALRSTVDANNQLRELDEANNAATVYIEIEGSRVAVIEKPRQFFNRNEES